MTVLAWLAFAQVIAAAPLPATAITAAEIEATAARSIANKISDTEIRTVDAGGHHVGIGIVYREKGERLSAASSHDQVTEVYEILEGVGTIVTGGAIVNPQRRRNVTEVVAQMNGPGVAGNGIDGGLRRRLTKGDLVIIPAGTPHGFSDVEETLTILVVRIDPARVVALK